MNTQYEEESGTDRILDILVGVVGLTPKIILLLWILLAGGVPVALQGITGDTTADMVVPEVVPTVEVAVVVPTDVPAVPTVAMLELVPAINPPSIDEAGVLAPGDFAISPAELALAWAATQVGGSAIDPSNRQPGLPPHLLIDFNADGSNGTADNSVLSPRMLIIPVAAYRQMMDEAGTPDSAAAFDNLKALLDQQPSGSDVAIPTPPMMGDLQQQPVARIAFIPFEGGQAVGYVAHFAAVPGPITNDDGLTYVVQGLTDDGNHYILGQWPLGANFLPDTVGDIPDDSLSAIESDIAAYLATVGSDTEAAADTDFTPNLGSLRNALGTIAIGAGAAAKIAASQPVAQTEAPQLVGTVWQWTAFEDTAGENDVTVENPGNYEIVFWPDGSYSIKADCNVGGGSYVLDGASLTINPGMSTLAFCGEESLDTQFRDGLFATATYVFDDSGNLVLNLAADAGNMVFANGGSAELADSGDPEDQTAAVDDGLTSTAYQWTSVTDADGTVTAVPNPENYQVIMNPDGTFNFQADCNVGSGRYEYNEDGSIVFLPGPMTRAFCGEDSLDQQFLEAITGTVSFTVDDNGDVTADLDDGRTASLINAGPVSTDGDMTVSMGATDDIIGTVWQWTRFDDTADLNNIVVPDPENYELVLWPDGAFSLKADCNIARGNYELDSPTLSLVVGPTTRALCSPESLSDTFIGRVGQTVSYVIDDEGNLNLNLFADAGNMVFAPAGMAELGESAAAEDQPGAADAGLTGLAFNWSGFTDAGGNVVTVDNPEDYSLVLLPDGTFNIKADCNVGSGTFTYGEDGTITFDLGPLTRALCPPDSLSDEFLAFVNSLNGATVNPDGGVVVTTADGTEGSFVAGGPVEIPQSTLPTTDVGAQPTSDGDLFNTVWNWTLLEDAGGATTLTVDDPTRYQVLFGPDANYALRADCNTGSGTYSGQGDESINALTINPGITSLAACGSDSLDTQFTSNLFATESYTIDPDGNLRLALADGGTMVFANGGSATELTSQPEPQVQPPGPANVLENTTWQWVNFRDAKQDYSVTGSENYTISFLPDGAVAVRADCNNGSGSYSVDGSSLNISILVTTAAACGEGSLGDVFLEHLNQAAIYHHRRYDDAR